MIVHPQAALAVAAFLSVSSWDEGIERDAVAVVSDTTISDAPVFRRVRAYAFERGSEGEVRAVCGEVALPGTTRDWVRFVALYRRDGDGWARVSDPAVEEWAADEPLRPPRLLAAMWEKFCRDAAPPPPLIAARDPD